MRSRSASVNAAANDSPPFSSSAHAAVVVVVDHHEQADPAAEAPQRLDERRAPERAVLVLDVVAKPIGSWIVVASITNPPSSSCWCAIAWARDRIDHVRVLRLVEQAVDEPGRMEAEVAADRAGCSGCPAAPSAGAAAACSASPPRRRPRPRRRA